MLYHIYGSARGEVILHGRFFHFGGMLLRNLKTKERHTGTELPQTLRHAPKELAKKSLLAAKEKGEEQLLQAAQSGMCGTEQTAQEESVGNQLLGKTGEWSRDIAAIGGDMLRHVSARAVAGRREHRMEQRVEEAIPHSESGQLNRAAGGEKVGRPSARTCETARTLKAGKGPTPAGKDRAGNTPRLKTNRPCGETSGTADKAGGGGREESGKGGRPGVGQYGQRMHCSNQKPCGGSGRRRRACIVHCSARLFDRLCGRFCIRHFLFSRTDRERHDAEASGADAERGILPAA